MNPLERASHPSRAQIEELLEFLERHPSQAKGFSKIPSVRDASRKIWEDLSIKLNSIEGCVKSWKQWTKYWADKKSAVKKKAALRHQAQNKIGNGNELITISPVEERILSLMGIEGFAVGDKQHKIKPFEVALCQSSPVDDDNPSLLANKVLMPTGSPTVPEATTVRPRTPPRLSSNTTPLSSSTLSGSQQHLRLRTHRRLERSPALSAAGGAHRRRQRPLSSTQRQSRYVNLSERFLRLEEQRIEIERNNSEALIQRVEISRRKSEALMCIAESLKVLAENFKR